MPNELKFLVVGCGSMGKNHIRTLKALGYNDLVVVDPVLSVKPPERILLLSSLHHVDFANVDAAIISSPTSTHLDVFQFLTASGVKHIFCEKPALIPGDLIPFNVNFWAGFIETCNPSVLAGREFMVAGAIGDVKKIICSRLGGAPSDIVSAKNVIIDLGSHDISIIFRLLGREPKMKLVHSKRDLSGIITSSLIVDDDDDVMISCESSWNVANKVRRTEIYGSRGTLELDLATQSVRFKENEFCSQTAASELKYTSWNKAAAWIEVDVEKQEPLRIQMSKFINSILHGEILRENLDVSSFVGQFADV